MKLGELAPSLMLVGQAAMVEQARSRANGWLTRTESQRLESIHRTERCNQFLASRHALRSLLTRALGTTHSWYLDAVAQQAPSVSPLHGVLSQRCQLSLSHSADLLACAMATEAIGIDIEVQDVARTRNVSALAELVCTVLERKALDECKNVWSQQRLFMLYWCIKEAYFKAIGSGIDMEQIVALECQPALEVMESDSVVAYTKIWQGRTNIEQIITLAACTLQPAAEMVLYVETPLQWQLQSQWVVRRV